MSKTEVVLKGPDRSETISIWNNQPDGARLLVGLVAGAAGTVLWIAALYEISANDRTFSDEFPFYTSLFGTAAVGTGALLVLTGWHPRTPADLESFCHEATGPNVN